MKKRGSAEIIGVAILVTMLLFGSIGSYKILSENRYVGDSSAKLIYDLSKCDISDIQKEHLINFHDQEEVEEVLGDGYQFAECSK